jgi:hypothetical protein
VVGSGALMTSSTRRSTRTSASGCGGRCRP